MSGHLRGVPPPVELCGRSDALASPPLADFGICGLASQPRQRLDPAVSVTRRGNIAAVPPTSRSAGISLAMTGSACHRFDNGQPEPFAIGRNTTNRRGDRRGKLRAFQKWQLHDPVDQVETFGELLLSRADAPPTRTSLASDRGGGPCEHLEQNVDALPRNAARYMQHLESGSAELPINVGVGLHVGHRRAGWMRTEIRNTRLTDRHGLLRSTLLAWLR